MATITSGRSPRRTGHGSARQSARLTTGTLRSLALLSITTGWLGASLPIVLLSGCFYERFQLDGRADGANGGETGEFSDRNPGSSSGGVTGAAPLGGSTPQTTARSVGGRSGSGSSTAGGTSSPRGGTTGNTRTGVESGGRNALGTRSSTAPAQGGSVAAGGASAPKGSSGSGGQSGVISSVRSSGGSSAAGVSSTVGGAGTTGGGLAVAGTFSTGGSSGLGGGTSWASAGSLASAGMVPSCARLDANCGVEGDDCCLSRHAFGSEPRPGAGAHPKVADSGWLLAWSEDTTRVPANSKELVASLKWKRSRADAGPTQSSTSVRRSVLRSMADWAL